MKQGVWVSVRARRLIVISIAVLLYIALAVLDTRQTFSHPIALQHLIIPASISFGFSLSVALIFLAVGSVTWFYSRDRQVSFLLFIFSSVIMVAFELETSSLVGGSNTRLLGAIANLASLTAIPLFALILLIFPKDFLTLSLKILTRNRLHNIPLVLRYYIFLLISAICIGIVNPFITYFVYPQNPSNWLNGIALGSIIFALTGSLVTIITSFRKSTLREREQLRFFVGGVILALAPLLLLTVVPQTIDVLAPYAVDAQITTLTVILLPLSLGYSILRYQFLVFDTYIRRTVSSTIGTIGLVIVAYLVFMVGTRLAGAFSLVLTVAVVIVATAICAPLTWWFAKQLTERVLFKETLRYRQLIDRPMKIGNEVLDLENIGQLVTEAAVETFKTPQVNLFVLAKDANHYILFPPLHDEQEDEVRRLLAFRLASSLSTAPTMTGTPDRLELQETAQKRLVNARRPLLLYEVTRAEEDMPTGLSRYLTSSLPEEQNAPLIAPVHVQGKMIALLVLGERADGQSYAGPDFEIVELLISRYAATLETARMTEELRVAYEHQKELDVLKDQFIMTASHELRTPLTATLGYIELLAEYNETLSPDMRVGFVTKARRGCDELLLMVNNMMDANCVQDNVNNIKISPISLKEAVVHIVDIVEPVVEREHRTVSIHISPTLLVMADALRLQQVLLNLINNAFKYSPQGTSVEISTEEDAEHVTVCIRDYGSGIPKEDQTRLFERFVRLERDMNSPTRGAGLGLYISKQLIRAMGGKIWVQSTSVEGEGSFFYFTLRLAPTHLETVEQKGISALA